MSALCGDRVRLALWSGPQVADARTAATCGNLLDTHIAYRLDAPGPVRLSVYNPLGQPVRTLVDGFRDAGAYQVTWDARDHQGAGVAAGVYVARLRHAHGAETRRLLYLK